MQSVRVSVPGGIKPVPCHLLSIVRTQQQSVDQLFTGICGWIGKEGSDFRRGRRQTRERKRNASNERRSIRFRIDRQTLRSQPGFKKKIDGIDCGWVTNGGQCHAGGRLKGPVFFVWCTSLNPLLEQRLLLGRQHFVGIGRRHDKVGVWISYPREQFTCRHIPGDNGPGTTFEREERCWSQIKTQS